MPRHSELEEHFWTPVSLYSFIFSFNDCITIPCDWTKLHVSVHFPYIKHPCAHTHVILCSSCQTEGMWGMEAHTSESSSLKWQLNEMLWFMGTTIRSSSVEFIPDCLCTTDTPHNEPNHSDCVCLGPDITWGGGKSLRRKNSSRPQCRRWCFWSWF